MGASVIRNNWA